jgi:dTDP-4-amino-4,6-dideoxygalactose transaminase
MSRELDAIRTRGEFLVFGSPLIGEEECEEVRDCLASGWLGTGPKVARFESEFREYKGADYAVAVNSCTAALHLSMLVAGLEPGDEVITTPLTFCSTVNAIIHAGATPILADVDPVTMNIDPKRVRERIGPRTRAILPVHFAGRACEMEELCAISEEHDLVLVEDCAHAIETEYHGRRAGTFGDFGCFSFYVTKNLAMGEGGMVLARGEDHANRIKILALHGLSNDAWKRFGDEGYKHYQVVECGYKYNMMDLQAAIGLHQLRRVEKSWKRRQAIWETYERELQDVPLVLPAPPEPNTRHAHHLYTVLVDPDRSKVDRETFLAAITREKIGVGVHYRSIPTHPFYQERFGWRPEDYPESHRIGEQTVSLPISPKLTDEDVDDVVAAVRRVLGCD